MNSRPVSIGEPIHPHMTAEWYNNTLRETNPDKGSRDLRVQRTEGEHRVVAKANRNRFYPMAIEDMLYEHDLENRGYYVDNNTDEWNWVVPQEDARVGDTVLVVTSGITRAYVDTTKAGYRVTYNPATQQLETGTKGKGQLLAIGTSGPSLINISNYAESSLNIQYKATSKNVNGSFQAIILSAESNLLELGSTVTITDPHNLFGESQIDSIGWAKYIIQKVCGNSCEYTWTNNAWVQTQACSTCDCQPAPGRTGSPSEVVTLPCVDLVPKWEVITASLPTQRMVVLLKQDLKVTQSTGVAKTNLIEYRSPYPSVQIPPIAPNDVTFYNTWKLEGLKDSIALLERVSNRTHQTTNSNISGDPAGTPETAFLWQVMKIRDIKARWITIAYDSTSSGEHTVTDSWEGVAPVDPDFVFPLGEPCVDSNCVACYAPETDDYRVISSESAMLGPPSTMTIPVGAPSFNECSLEGSMQNIKAFPCKSIPFPWAAPMSLVAVDVVTSFTDDTDELVIGNATIYVCKSVAGYDDAYPYTECVECEGECTYTWYYVDDSGPAPWNSGASLADWKLTAECENGCECAGPPEELPNNTSEEIQTFPCNEAEETTPPPNPCAGTCTYSWSGMTWDDANGEWVLDTNITCPETCNCVAPDVNDTPSDENDLTRTGACIE